MPEESNQNTLPHLDRERVPPPGDATPADEASGTLAQITPSPAALACAPFGVQVAGYEVLGELGRGGMGAVFKGRDLELGRDLAIKVLLEARQADATTVQRFLEEAQIGGQLQHPGVAPLYEVGRLADNRPYFTMKLVEGGTLSALLKARRTSADDLPRFLKIFEQICQTLAYAHTRGVIHRDLKPLNVMVGAFGEVQVMDWGLAKVVKGGAVRMTRSGASDSETTGTVLGTPAYMAPEQACGDVDAVDERSDVFGLGAILCEILTGEPPYRSRESGSLLRQAAQADLTDAVERLQACGADAEPVRLAKSCLSAKPADRPADGGAAAQAMTNYLAGVQERLRTSEMERAAAQARAREERKRRRLTVVLAATLLLAAAGASAGALWYQQDRAARAAEHARRLSETEREVTAALDEAAALGAQAQKLKDDPAKWEAALGEALSAVKRADGVLHGGVGAEPLRERVDARRRELEAADKDRRMIVRLEEARNRKAEASKEGFDNAGSAALYAAAFDEDMNLAALEAKEAAERINRRAIREDLLDALAEWLDATPNKEEEQRLRVLLQTADPDPASFRNRVIAFTAKKDWEGLRGLAVSPETMNQPPAKLQFLGRRLGATEGVKFFRAANARHPTDFWIIFQLAYAFHGTGTISDANDSARYYTAAVALRPDSAAVHNNLGNVLGGLGRLDEAIAEYRKAIQIKPGFAAPHGGLSFALRDKRQLDEAVKESRIAIEQNPEDGSFHLILGLIFSDKGQTGEATAEYRNAVKVDPKYPYGYYYLAAALVASGETEEAIRCYRKLIELKPDYVQARIQLGIILEENGRLDEAGAEYSKAAETNPQSPLAHSNRAFVLRKQGRFSESLTAFRRAHEIGSKDPSWAMPSAAWVRDAEEFVRLEALLPLFLKKEAEPACPEAGVKLAQLCYYKNRYRDSVRFFRQSFAAGPGLAEDLNGDYLYLAACAAGLGGSKTEGNANAQDLMDYALMRKQALDWLRLDLGTWTKKIETEPKSRAGAGQALRHWRKDQALAGVRDNEALTKLPADEQNAWRQFWSDVDAQLKKAETALPLQNMN